jgi:hypothetical protein
MYINILTLESESTFSYATGLSRWTISLVGVPPRDIQVLPEQQAREKTKKREEFISDF